MNAKALAVQFQFTHMVLNRNLDGITHEESVQLPPSGNCLNWVAGHITATRDNILQILDESPVWTLKNKESYTRGSTPWKNGNEAERLEKIREKFEESQKKLSAKILSLDGATLSAPVPAKKNAFRVDSLAEMLAAFAFHESYHVGQTGILRRLAGKEGAIK